MKKSLIILPLFVLLLAGCGEDIDCDSYCASICPTSSEAPTSAPTTTSEPAPTTESTTSGTTATTTSPTTETTTSSTPVGEHTVVLVLGQGGLYKGAPGSTYDIYENTVLYHEPIGADLPGASDVTNTSGSTFTAWVAYEAQGVPTVYTKVPNEDYKVLYAQFSGGGSTTIPPTTSVDPTTSGPTTSSTTPAPTTWTFYFEMKPWWQDANAVTRMHLWNNDGKTTDWPGLGLTYVADGDEGKKYYSLEIDNAYTTAILSRWDPANTSFTGDPWNKIDSLDLTARTGNCLWADVNGGNITFGWFTYSPAA